MYMERFQRATQRVLSYIRTHAGRGAGETLHAGFLIFLFTRITKKANNSIEFNVFYIYRTMRVNVRFFSPRKLRAHHILLCRTRYCYARARDVEPPLTDPRRPYHDLPVKITALRVYA